jgi:hypothetical protein
MKKTFVVIFALLALNFQSVHAASPQEVKIKLKTTYKVAGSPTGGSQTTGDRYFITFSSNHITPQQSQLYWIDKTFKVHAVALNNKQLALPAGFLPFSFNGKNFFEANIGSTRNSPREIMSVDTNEKLKKWEFPGYKYCAAGVVVGDLLYVGCYNPSRQRSKSYNSNREGAHSFGGGWSFDIDALFTISTGDKITKVDMPSGHSVDLIWLGAKQILVQTDSKLDPRQLSYYYLENGSLNYAFDLPDTVRIGQLTSAGWAVNLPSDINSPLFSCPVHTVLSTDGQFNTVSNSPACISGFPDARVIGLVGHGFLPGATNYQTQGDTECAKNLVSRTTRFVGFYNGTVLCYNDIETGDNMIHAFPSTYSSPQLSNDSFPVVKQVKVPSVGAYTPEATTPATTAGFPTSCPEIENTKKIKEPLVVGFHFDGTDQDFVRIGEGTTVGAKAPASLVGCYADFETLRKSPGGNFYAIGSINQDDSGFYWINSGGVHWRLTLNGSTMITGKENPYYSDGHQFILQTNTAPISKPASSPILQAAGAGDAKWPAKCPAVMDTVSGPVPKISGFKFDGSGGEIYVRLADGGSSPSTAPASLLGCYADIPSLNSAQANAWHIGTINRDASGFYWQNAAGVRWGLTLSGSNLITDKSNPYYDKGHQFITY